MFRTPMRLEKWIAFDGALGVDLAEAAVDDTAPDTVQDESGEAGGESAPESGDPQTPDAFAVLSGIMPLSGGDEYNHIKIDTDPNRPGYEVEFKLPYDVVLNGSDWRQLPFWNSSLDVSIASGIDCTQFYFEIEHPANGTFFFLNKSQVQNYNVVGLGEWIAFTNGNTYTNPSNPTLDGRLIVYLSHKTSGGIYNSNPNLVVEDTGTSLRFAVVADLNSNSFTAAEFLKIVLRSIAFRADSSGETALDPFTIKIYYSDTPLDIYSNSSGQDMMTDSPGGYFDPVDNPPTVELDDASAAHPDGGIVVGDGGDDPDPEVPNPPGEIEDPNPPVDPDPDPDPDPEPDPDPDPDPTPTDPVTPPTVDIGQPGSDASGGDASGDSSGMGGDSDAGGEGSGDAVGQDDMMYIYRREDEGGERNDGGGAGENKDGAVQVVEAVLVDEKAVETAAAAAALELTRDFEALIASVREDKKLLEVSLARLQNEYMSRGAEEVRGIRDALRELFSSGNREMSAVNRVLDEMNRQLGEYKNLPVARRDGMLSESLRELLDIAARRSGETGAMSEAINAIADLLENSRRSGESLPPADRLAAVFAETHETALARWLARAARSDPMGKELAAAKD